MLVKMISAISFLALTSAAFGKAESVTNGGEILEGLIRSCDILGISNTGDASYVGYYFKNIRSGDIVAVQGNSVTIRNTTKEDFSVYRPRIITLTLNSVERENGVPVVYYISGSYAGISRFVVDPETGAGRDGQNVLLGSLGEIAFSPSDVLEKTGERSKLRGTLTYVDLNTQTDEVTIPRSSFGNTPKIFGWDLATPSSINRDAFCKAGQ
ncbi:MAG: hypothetical protein WCI18_13290 [Pseudomonadota bacterium]